MKMTNPFLTLVTLLAFAVLPLQGQETPPATTGGDDEAVKLQFLNSPVDDIIKNYEQLTGKRVIRDSTLAQGVNLNIVVNGTLKKSEAIHLIEASLLLNGVALTPGPDGSIKALNVIGGGKNPRSEGVPVYASLSALPPGEQVVSYFMSLRYISAAEAAQVFQQQVALHPPYGVVVPVPNAQAVVITETTSAIRQLAKLQKLIDVPPAKVVSEFVSLKRADAERVADTLTKMLEARRNNQTALGQPPAPSPDFPDDNSGPNERNIVAGTVQMIPDARTNRILVVTRPINFAYIKSLILQFDEAADISAPFERSLKYVSAGEVLPVLQKALAETKEDAQGTAAGQGQGQNRQTSNRSTSSNTSTTNVMDSVQSPTEDTTPESVIVGKTKLIADKRANSILVIGPPESVTRASEILNRLDSAPRQVYLATVIGELSLVNETEFGVDLLQKWSGGHTGVASGSRTTGATAVDGTSLTSVGAFPTTAGLTIYGAVGSTLNYYVRALQTSNRFKVLSRPSVYTSNNKKAVITTGQQVPVPGTSQSTVNTNSTDSTVVTSTVEYKNVELQLSVVPLINSEKEVTLQIAQKNDTLGSNSVIGGNEVPAINTQQFTTSVTVPNKQTVVLGGLIINSANHDVTGLPWLSNIPLLGYLFKDTSRKSSRREIIILIEPNVIPTQEELLTASKQEQNKTIVGEEANLMNSTPGIYNPTDNYGDPKKKKTSVGTKP